MHRLNKNYFLIILVIFFLYSALLIFSSSFVIDHTRYFSLFDDEMVSMRYAYNLAHGHGLVWNAGGEKIEGFTNPLWTLYMAGVHLLPVSIEKISIILQLTSMVAVMFTLYFVKKIVDNLTHKTKFAALIAILFTAFYFPLINWSIIQGTEVSILMLILAWSTYLLFKQLDRKGFSYLFFILLGIGIWTRLDFTISAVVLIGLLFIFNKSQRRTIIMKGTPLFLLFLITQIILRYWYYHDIFPNTYYLKMTGFPILNRITNGIYVTFKEMNLALVVIPFIYACVTRNKKLIILLILFTTQLLYSMYVGGDAWEYFGGANRYVVIAMPLFFISLAYVLYSVRRVMKKKNFLQLYNYSFIETFCLIFIFILFNTGSINMLLYLTMIKTFPTIDENANQVRMARSLAQITKPHAKLGIVMAGVTPYFLPEREFIDLLGKSDRVIAHEESHRDTTITGLKQYIAYRPGHTKWDYEYVVSKLKPDVFGQVFPGTELIFLKKDYKKYLTKEGYLYYIRKNDSD